MIDPKINLRVHKDTPLEIYELGTQLTKEGLGFPQYSNDEVVIPGLLELGYDLEDARNYAVAIKKFVFETKEIQKEELLAALNVNFKGFENLQIKLKTEGPKFGNNDDFVDGIASELLDCFADAVKGLKNNRGGIYRAGTGSAMYYLWHGYELGATPDGRNKGEPLPANYSPSLGLKLKGPMSLISSFTKPNLKGVINGGPLTLELQAQLFRNDDALRKVAMLVKAFMDFGGHQLQLNTIDLKVLKAAQENPCQYKNLIVRVWGWSGYFVELDREFQDHIINRTAFSAS